METSNWLKKERRLRVKGVEWKIVIKLVLQGQARIQPLEKGAKLLTDHGVQEVPLHREILHIWAQLVRFGAYFLPALYWKSLKLFPIKMLFFFNYGRTIRKWVIYPAHASPSLSPSYSLFTYYFVIAGIFRCPDLFFFKQIMLYRSSAMFNCKGSKQKRGSRGQSPLVGVRGLCPLKLTLFRG